jgi:Ca-activated chloride channel family protein
MNATQRTICAGLVLAATACGHAIRADEPSRDFALGVNAANAALRGGDVDGAIKQYGEMRSAAPESADLSYNMAVAQFRKGEVAAAAPLFEAAATSENDTLAANARYNLGNCNYTAGLKLAESDREAAIKELESAIGNYRSSLAVDTNNADARANIELASQLIDKLREEQKQQQQQQNQQDQQQQQSNDEQQNDQQQQNNQQQSSQGKQDKKQQNEDQQKQDQQSA